MKNGSEMMNDIRLADVSDAGLVSVLATTTFYEAYFEQDDPADLANYIIESFSPATIAEQLTEPGSYYFIVSLDGRAVGYARLVSGSPDPSIKTERTLELKRLYLVERVWGKGVGEALLRHCEEFTREEGFDSIWLGVWQQNRRGQRFYAKQGFVKTGTLTFAYGESVGVNDVMEKKL
jgi:diamine N-acetyltransferase